jgi:hypothetical protein
MTIAFAATYTGREVSVAAEMHSRLARSREIGNEVCRKPIPYTVIKMTVATTMRFCRARSSRKRLATRKALVIKAGKIWTSPLWRSAITWLGMPISAVQTEQRASTWIYRRLRLKNVSSLVLALDKARWVLIP